MDVFFLKPQILVVSDGGGCFGRKITHHARNEEVPNRYVFKSMSYKVCFRNFFSVFPVIQGLDHQKIPDRQRLVTFSNI